MLFAKELFKAYPTTKMLLAVQSAQMHFSSMQSIKIMEIPKMQAIFACLCYTFTLSLPQLEPAEKSKLYVVQKISFLLELKCAAVLLAFGRETYVFSLALFSSSLPVFLQKHREREKRWSVRRRGSTFDFYFELYWNVLSPSKPVIQT